MQGRPLTYDEQKAADAAFAGNPFNPDWSADAKVVCQRSSNNPQVWSLNSPHPLTKEECDGS